MPRLKGLRHLRVFALPPVWEACAGFYAETLGLRRASLDDRKGVAVFKLGARDTLSVERVDPKDPEERDRPGRFLGVSIEVDDIRRAYRELSAGGVMFDAAPQAQAWGGILTHFRDPAGNVLSLVQAKR
jgi:lactoylglutathione lyase